MWAIDLKKVDCCRKPNSLTGRKPPKPYENSILGKKIDGEAVTRDIYGRIVCRVVCDKRDMSLTMIRQGYAWPYYQYFYRLSPKERAAYKKAALLAKTEGLGLWQEKNPTAPWQWRKDHRTVFTRLMYWLRRFVRWILRR